MTEREIAEIEKVLRAVPKKTRHVAIDWYEYDNDWAGIARAVVERVVGPLDRRACDETDRLWQQYAKHVADRDARLARLVEAAESIKKFFHPSPGHGTCLLCRKAGGEHSADCPIGLTVATLDGVGAREDL